MIPNLPDSVKPSSWPRSTTGINCCQPGQVGDGAQDLKVTWQGTAMLRECFVRGDEYNRTRAAWTLQDDDGDERRILELANQKLYRRFP